MIDLAGKKALVTGGSSGIGRAIAETLARAGAHVCVADITEAAREGGEPTAARIAAHGGSAEFVTLDVTESAHVAAVFSELDERLGGVDILVNNAGVLREGSVADTDDETWRVQFSVNVDGTFHCTREMVRALLRARRPGKIVNISSISGFRGNPGFAAYCASKGAIVNFTRQVALDYAAQGINVNAVAPGFVTTQMTALYDRATHDALAGQTPRGTWASPQDVANAVLFLSSSLADHICGENVLVDGGWTIGTPVSV
ncbi:putative 3-ketoacyl-acyl carrier protein reductase [Mycolicibacterium mageritense DSM 44476 = CIP 104973]|uniref:3-oxoacyl-[acyl-carrier-protein] reductase FabG n=1 Tax=Mycolicibacterium mageritense TaxID=53462 RepID=A0AAI8XND8_MYCME|nr:SDR family NAD(P)-dependent oxidoreductase [Mycolicibacterium mageritense]MCC9180251.1 SDR family oxidoreductase [Mycolicibacterium mageritense]CDO22821.1 dehydrogenase [Mycolicibacterium mageritense DSM 44476 = CIP 104973]BBX32638.1 beta-ketoacyl-ACP reductase [Mycolicibacterium mageritense]BDY28693.1 3-oxoacyl-[acyl-carrier-protein] reductase FabG [Mycolicibacterium mageritense]GJJ20406.1 beta-ketoacyl-ACP reductase [Mycolicibacterium mageritense]